ncbi:MAG: type II toxin-antitoxin system VapC family toxin, partial [Tepidiformaceae bacterium]
MTHAGSSRFRRDIFVDSSAFFALATVRSDHFPSARRILERAEAARFPLVTSSYILAEAHALLVNRVSRQAGLEFLEFVDRSTITVVWPGEAHFVAARQIIDRYADKDFSLTDAISFVVMEQL